MTRPGDTLLLHVASRRSRRYGPFERSAGRSLPLGSLLLAGERGWRFFDAGDTLPLASGSGPGLGFGLGPGPGAGPAPSRVIVRAANDWDRALAGEWLCALRRWWPGASLLLAAPRGVEGGLAAEGWDGLWPAAAADGAAGSGFGREAVTTLTGLGGGSGPACYRAGWLETVTQPGFDLYQPWRGLDDRRFGLTPAWLPPPPGFLPPLLGWIAAGGWRSVLFVVPAGATRSEILGLAAMAARAGLRCALRLEDPGLLPGLVGLEPAPEILWLSPGEREPPTPAGDGGGDRSAADWRQTLPGLAGAGIRLGLRLASGTPAAWWGPEFAGLWRAVSFVAPGGWPAERLRQTLGGVARHSGCCWQLLSDIRRPVDLLRALRGSYGVLAGLLGL